MIYTHRNTVRSCTVHEIETKAVIGNVAEVNTKAGWVKVYDEPLMVDTRGNIVSRRIRFDAIHPIGGTTQRPEAFHCYGRKG